MYDGECIVTVLVVHKCKVLTQLARAMLDVSNVPMCWFYAYVRNI